MSTNNLVPWTDSAEPSLPPFQFTYWNPFSKDSHLVTSWFDYIKDVTVAKYAADSVGRYVQQTSAAQINALYTVGNAICGQISHLTEGISEVQHGIAHLQFQLDRVGDLIRGVNRRLDLVADALRTQNILQENIAELLRIPESQKQRQHHIEMGLKFLQHALKDNDLYRDALHELLEAEQLMPYDYFVLHRIGLIYLYVPELGDLSKAFEYFTRAGKYAAVESDPGAVSLNNILTKRIGTNFDGQVQSSAQDVSELTAESYLQAATALYALGEFQKAVAMAEKAVKYNQHEATNWFFLAKYLTRVGNADGAAKHLEKAVELVPAMALAALGDFDLNSSRTILDSLARLDSDTNARIERLIKAITDIPVINHFHQEALELVTEAQGSLREGSYTDKVSMVSILRRKKRDLEVIHHLESIDQYRIPFNKVEAKRLLQEGFTSSAKYVDKEYFIRYPLYRLDKLINVTPEVRYLINAQLQDTWLGRVLLITSDYLITLNRNNLDPKLHYLFLTLCQQCLMEQLEQQHTTVNPSDLDAYLNDPSLVGLNMNVNPKTISEAINYLTVAGVLSDNDGDNPRQILYDPRFSFIYIPPSGWGVCPKCGNGNTINFLGGNENCRLEHERQCSSCGFTQVFPSYELAKAAWRTFEKTTFSG